MRKLIGPTALIVGLVLGSAALADPAPNPSNQAAAASEPVVQLKHTGQRTMIDAPIDDITASQAVNYSDLNLANPADVKTLDQRIEAAAAQSCSELRADYPPEFYPKVSGGPCVSSAVHRAEAAVNQAVEAAADN